MKIQGTEKFKGQTWPAGVGKFVLPNVLTWIAPSACMKHS